MYFYLLLDLLSQILLLIVFDFFFITVLPVWAPTHFFFSSFVCLYTNKYNILCRFYVILFVHFYIKKYNSVPLYFISFSILTFY